MAQPDTALLIRVCKKSYLSAVAWLPGMLLPVIAQNTVVAGEVSAPLSHHPNTFLNTLFPILNNTALVALVGVVVFGLIWLVQRKNVVEDVTVTEGGATDQAAATVISEAQASSVVESTEVKAEEPSSDKEVPDATA